MNLGWKMHIVKRCGISSSVHSYDEYDKKEMEWCLEIRYETRRNCYNKLAMWYGHG